MQNLTHIYFGNGKGKTTAALGTALRALENNLSVHLVQFLKPNPTSEISALEKFQNFSHKQFGTKEMITNPNEKQKQKANEAFTHLKNSLEKHDVIIADEILYALQFNLLEEKQIIDLIKSKPKNTELILTGSHKPFPEIFAEVDYVTEIKKIKHPFDSGIQARKGFEF